MSSAVLSETARRAGYNLSRQRCSCGMHLVGLTFMCRRRTYKTVRVYMRRSGPMQASCSSFCCTIELRSRNANLRLRAGRLQSSFLTSMVIKNVMDRLLVERQDSTCKIASGTSVDAENGICERYIREREAPYGWCYLMK